MKAIDAIKITCQTDNGIEFLKQIKSSPPDVAIVNYNIPEVSGLAITKSIKELLSGVKIIGTVASTNILNIANFFRAGADTVITDRNKTHELIDAIIQLHENGTHHNENYYQFIRHLSEKKQPFPTVKNPWLILDEMDVLIIEMIYYEELTHAEIAERLKYITRKTIDHRVEKMTRLLGCKRFMGVIRICIEHKILSPQ